MRLGQLTISACALGVLGGCGPDDRPYDRCLREPNFVVSIVPEEEQVFPNDTRVTFQYGGTREIYELTQPSCPDFCRDTEPVCKCRTPKVVFCEPRTSADAGINTGGAQGNADDAGGAGEAANSGDGVHAIQCGLWTLGSTDVDVEASGFGPIDERQRLLQREGDECTVRKTLVVPLLEPYSQPRE